MSLVLRSSVNEKSDNSSLFLYDKAGIFNNISTSPYFDPTGWEDSSTAFIADTISAQAIVTLPDPATLLAAGTPITIDVSSKLPNIINVPFEVLATALGYGNGILPDGNFLIDYHVVVNVNSVPTTFDSYCNVVFYGNVCCCIQEQLAKIESCDCECRDVSELLYGQLLLKNLRRLIECNKINKAICVLKELKSICAKKGCKSCK